METDAKNKQEYAIKLSKQAPLKMASSFLKVFGTAASFFGPKGEVAGAALNFAGQAVDFFTPSASPVSGKQLNPATYLNMNNELEYSGVA